MRTFMQHLEKLLELLRVVLHISDYLDCYILPTVGALVQVTKGPRGNLLLKSNFTRLQLPIINWRGRPLEL